ncbi:MAG: hypothetical protein HY735_18805 [Verrucomicrobia bacterium]|nr:hypothetical protein [Verrucomicrobiota bacterium]
MTDVPDYSWYAGCFGIAAGNMTGYWDRHGFPNMYTGPTGKGVAPLNSDGANEGIRSMWATKGGLDGRPADQPGHIDDYWRYYLSDGVNSYQSTAPDPYLASRRSEHAPDCISDFMGASQNKWKNLDGECDGNIDAYAVTYWDRTGLRRVNYVPPPQGALAVRDVPSGLRAWTQYRGYDCIVFSQLVDFNPTVPTGKGFTFADLKAEIDAGYPVMLFLQRYDEFSRPLANMPRANPNVHGMLAYGYLIADDGREFVRYKTSWGGSGDNSIRLWNSSDWEADLPVRGVIGYHPLPRIVAVARSDKGLTIQWHGPSTVLRNLRTGEAKSVHRYVVEQSPVVNFDSVEAVSEPTAILETTIPNCCGNTTFFRVRLLSP